MSADRHVVTRLGTTAIKGLRLQRPAEIVLEETGAVGDRDFFLVDRVGKLISLTKLGILLRMEAAYDRDTAQLCVTLDGGPACEGTVRLGGPIAPITDGGHVQAAAHEVIGPWSAFFSEAAACSLRLVRTDVPGAGSDASQVTLLGEASLAELSRQSGLGEIDSRRFRMLIEFGSAIPHVEDAWAGRTIAVGEARLQVGGPVPRCAAVTRHPEGGERDAPLVRAIRAYRGVTATGFGPGVPFGVYADVISGGRVRVGDPIRIEA